MRGEFCILPSAPSSKHATFFNCYQPIAAHDFSISLFDTSFYATFEESSCEEHCSPLIREGGQEVTPLESLLIAIEEHGCY